MNLFLFLVWLQMSAQPQIKIGEIRPMHHRCQVWMGSGWITLQAEMGALLCEEKDGQLVVIGSPDEVQATDSEVLGWTSANTAEKFFAEAAQRAADETDGKPPKCANGSNCYCGDTGCRDYTQKEWDEYLRIMAEPVEPYKPPEPVDVPAVQEPQTYKTGESNCKAAPKPPDWKDGMWNVVTCEDEMATRKVTTCAEKSRVLLTSEDGKKHCLKF